MSAAGTSSQMVVATLFEGSHEMGARALLNSLVASGFCGTFLCGVRGASPDWPRRIGEVTVEVEHLETPRHLTHYKPTFLKDVMDARPSAARLFYFDPDVIVKCPFGFLEAWVDDGIAAVADPNWMMPRTSPVRRRWLRLCREAGVAGVDRAEESTIDLYCNAGFVGLGVDDRGFLGTWRSVTDALERWGAKSDALHLDARTSPVMALDQDAFNIALMAWSSRASLMGPEAMDFAPGGQVLSHAVGTPKPWQKRFVLEALRGRPPTKRDLAFLKHTIGPLRVYSATKARRAAGAYKVGRTIGLLWRRSDY